MLVITESSVYTGNGWLHNLCPLPLPCTQPGVVVLDSVSGSTSGETGRSTDSSCVLGLVRDQPSVTPLRRLFRAPAVGSLTVDRIKHHHTWLSATDTVVIPLCRLFRTAAIGSLTVVRIGSPTPTRSAGGTHLTPGTWHHARAPAQRTNHHAPRTALLYLTHAFSTPLDGHVPRAGRTRRGVARGDATDLATYLAR
jgi:hypothetical protein